MGGSTATFSFSVRLMLVLLLIGVGNAQLSSNFYNSTSVNSAVSGEARMGASLLRLHFHDCFVNGCDASVLLDDTANFTGEKTAGPNANSLRGFDVIDNIKTQVERSCPGVVSCADILAVAARDGGRCWGPYWKVQLGRRDSTSASINTANTDIPSPFMDLPALINSFNKQGLNVKDLVALSGGHTLGFAQCLLFRNRIYNETNIDSTFASQRRATCPRNGGDSNLAPLDPTAALFDTKYFGNLVMKKGLLHSDQELFNGGETDSLVKMGNIKPLTGNQGQIRYNCRRVN
ncbi:hypothetical protein Pfo_029057 [Paulownia fortunei]|nr:hypothetical protein Pfo_029057 [Paulownia fortunei]